MIPTKSRPSSAVLLIYTFLWWLCTTSPTTQLFVNADIHNDESVSSSTTQFLRQTSNHNDNVKDNDNNNGGNTLRRQLPQNSNPNNNDVYDESQYEVVFYEMSLDFYPQDYVDTLTPQEQAALDRPTVRKIGKKVGHSDGGIRRMKRKLWEQQRQQQDQSQGQRRLVVPPEQPGTSRLPYEYIPCDPDAIEAGYVGSDEIFTFTYMEQTDSTEKPPAAGNGRTPQLTPDELNDLFSSMPDPWFEASTCLDSNYFNKRVVPSEPGYFELEAKDEPFSVADNVHGTVTIVGFRNMTELFGSDQFSAASYRSLLPVLKPLNSSDNFFGDLFSLGTITTLPFGEIYFNTNLKDRFQLENFNKHVLRGFTNDSGESWISPLMVPNFQNPVDIVHTVLHETGHAMLLEHFRASSKNIGVMAPNYIGPLRTPLSKELSGLCGNWANLEGTEAFQTNCASN